MALSCALKCKEHAAIQQVKSENRKQERWVRSNFQVDFWAHVYFQPTIHRSQNLVDFLPLSMPFCAFGAKRHGTEKSIAYVISVILVPLLSVPVQIGDLLAMSFISFELECTYTSFLFVPPFLVNIYILEFTPISLSGTGARDQAEKIIGNSWITGVSEPYKCQYFGRSLKIR